MKQQTTYTGTKHTSLLFTSMHVQSFSRKFCGQCGLSKTHYWNYL